jgi:serpin B
VASALGLAATGAAGRTRQEILDLLTAGAEPEKLAKLLSAAALDTRSAESDALFRVSSTLWADERANVRSEYAKELSGWPGAAVRSQEFAADPEAARGVINADVKRTTNGLVPEALPRGRITVETVAVLVNALYLKLGWVYRFPEGATTDAPFRAPAGTHDVPTMRLQERIGYQSAAAWQAATLPAEEGVDVVLLLPEGELAEGETSLGEATLDDLLTGGGQREVELYLPKFRLEDKYSLDGVLRSLGIDAMFDAADFSPMFEGEGISVDSVDHQAVLRVDEQGFEGAAVTTTIFMMAAVVGHEEPLVLRFDRPFLLFVRHRETGAIYFSARVTDV